MQLSVTSDVGLRYEIELDFGDGQKVWGILERQGGEWMLTKASGTTWIAQGRVDYPEAIKRALTQLHHRVDG
jgi:hypothetical protein